MLASEKLYTTSMNDLQYSQPLYKIEEVLMWNIVMPVWEVAL